ncbi:hypothetical protein ShzoTeo12_53770 (plasmid) [Shinella zoogloeoides]|nr:hypothetical protein ShzoTeo12_53770 [Shinella zoogloeoides]
MTSGPAVHTPVIRLMDNHFEDDRLTAPKIVETDLPEVTDRSTP